jgi:GNAT superfamily N-acetyltransferase
MSTLSIRQPTTADAASIARLSTQLGYPTEASQMPARLERFAADPNASAFVAERDGAVIGMATVHLRSTLNHDAPIAQITLLVVDETSRSHGVGRALVEAAEAWTQAQGAKRIVVTTQLHRTGAHAFYEKVGFTHTGRRYGKDFSQ